MNYPQPPAWATLALAGSLLAFSSAGAVHAQTNTTLKKNAAGQTAGSTSSTTIPTRLIATGLANPVGSQVQLTWVPVPRALGYKIYRDGQFLIGSDHAFLIDFAVSGGETHTYTVSSVGLAGGSALSASATAKVPLGGNKVIYSDALQNGWQSWSWAAVNLNSPSTVINKHTIQVKAGPWQAFYLHHAQFSTVNYTAVSFLAYGGNPAGQKLWVRATRNGVVQTPVPFSTLKSGQWQTVTVSLANLGVANVADMDGLWVQDATGHTQPSFYFGQIVLTPAAIVPPVAPASLTATPEWDAHCEVCNGLAMPHIILAWNAVSGATSYTLYRNGVQLQTGLTTPSCTDMALVSGQSYQYTVAAVNDGGAGAQSLSASAIAPTPPSGALGAPFNVAVNPQWGGGVANVLVWQAAPGAAAYNVYQSDVLIAHGLTLPIFTVNPDVIWAGGIFTVTALDAEGMESLPSAPVDNLGVQNPAAVQAGANYVPDAPDMLVATPEWNLGSPRIILHWHGTNTAHAYSVYRDRVKVASGLYDLYYIDPNIQPGEKHTYAIASDNTDLPISLGNYIESALSATVTATALTAAPTVYTGKVQITKIVPNDDSAVIFFTPIPGAVDYRVYDVMNPSKVKYAGQITLQMRYQLQARTPVCIEWNGIDPTKGVDLVVEAVDKFGPFQRMDGLAGSGAANTMNMSSMALNGQGDPSNVPNVLTASDSFHVDCRPFALTGDQVFFDNFRGSQPLVKQPCPAPVDGSPFYGKPHDFAIFANDKWEIRQYGADLTNSKLFFMDNHFMDTTYEGGGLGSSSPAHNNDATMVMMPKATADISSNRVLHVTFEVDAHMDSRRWCELLIGAPNDLLLDPAKFADFKQKPTVSGTLLRWQIQSSQDTLQMFSGDGTVPGVDLLKLANGNYPDSVSRIMWDHVGPFANGTDQDLDKRHRFDLYLSKTHFRIQETTPDGMYNMTQEGDFPAGTSLPFDKCQLYFNHQVYHTTNDRAELIEWGQYEPYWYNCRAHADERHWDNMGFEVLNAFPK
jgi:hypothetical protein